MKMYDLYVVLVDRRRQFEAQFFVPFDCLVALSTLSNTCFSRFLCLRQLYHARGVIIITIGICFGLYLRLISGALCMVFLCRVTYVVQGSHAFAMFALCEWVWLRAHINMTTFTQFAQNCNIFGGLLALYGSAMHIATVQPYLQTSFPALQCCTLKSLLFSVQHR